MSNESRQINGNPATKDGCAPDKCSCSVTNTSTSADLQVNITDRECLCGEINGRHCPIHQEPTEGNK